MKIRLGVWAGLAYVGQGPALPSKAGQGPALQSWRWKAGIVIGPLDKHRLPKIEAHLIGFKGNLYGEKITINLKKYLRPFANYKNISQLKKQIAKDIIRIKKLS